MPTRKIAATPKAEESLLEYLREQVQEAVAPLPGVGRKKMLVSIGWTVKDRVFALVSRQGRIVVRLPDDDAQKELLAIEGAGPWRWGSRTPPRGWLLLPEDRHDDSAFVTKWIERAFRLGHDAPAKPTPRAKKAAIAAVVRDGAPKKRARGGQPARAGSPSKKR